MEVDVGSADTVVVLDFETTGLSPTGGDRAIEVGAVLVERGVVTARFSELMNPGRPIPPFIESYTGITNDMLRGAAPCAQVMKRFYEFAGNANLVAHNASFDQRFLDAEWHRISKKRGGHFACSMLTARRLYQDAPNHKLGSLIQHLKIPSAGQFHRALYDSEMTAKLWLTMLSTIEERYRLPTVPFELMRKLAATPKRSVARLFTASP